MSQPDAKPGLKVRTRNFYDEVRNETRKVTWPSRAELQGATIVIFVVTVAFSIALGLTDSILGHAIEIVFKALA